MSDHEKTIACLQLDLADARRYIAELEARLVALLPAAVLQQRAFMLGAALEREIHRTRVCTENAIVAGIHEGIRSAVSAPRPHGLLAARKARR